MREVTINSPHNLKGLSLVFFLPVETRPKSLPTFSHPSIKTFWHTGIVHNNYVYETFNYGKYSKKQAKNRGQDLLEQKAIFVRINNLSEHRLETELYSGTSCDEYVLRCLELSDRKGSDKGDKFPDDVYEIVLE